MARRQPAVGSSFERLAPPLRDADQTGAPLLYPQNDRHWTPTGHAVAAQASAGFLRSEELIPPPQHAARAR